MKTILTVFLALLSFNCFAQKTITFPSNDGVIITADLYETNPPVNFILLCHLAEHSRGEYLQTAKKLMALGFNCLAVDLRVGKEIFGVQNQTSLDAKMKNKATGFLDAEQDIVAAIRYADSLAKGRGIILLGSSFSASLALKIGSTNPKIKAVIAFSPGEHFGEKLNLKSTLKGFNKPLFVTSSRDEAALVSVLVDEIPDSVKQQFVPEGKGTHGSLALWLMMPDHPEYWTALEQFLVESKLMVSR
jgi:dienelactone hydrolase